MKHWLLSLALLLGAALPARAHFVFIVPEAGGGAASVVLSESLAPDEDVDVSVIGGISLRTTDESGKASSLALGEPAGHAYRVSLPGRGPRVVSGSHVFGVRERRGGGAYLTVYHPRAIIGDPFRARAERDETPAAAEIVPVREGANVSFHVLARGKAAAGAQVTLLLLDGNEEQVTTDAQGRTKGYALAGRYGAWARVVEEKSGEHGGKPYAEVRHYPTLVVDVPKVERSAAAVTDRLPRMPEATSSFGAAVCDGWLYVYGGHTAPTHTYHTGAVSGRFHRIRIAPGGADGAWEALPPGPPLQGMNLVALGDKVYRVGGMAPRNADGSAADNFSVAECAAFDPAGGRWADVTPLPEPRSSHDVVALGGKLYVVGGWQLRGAAGDELWPEAALVLDPSAPDAAWKPLPQPFRRRALIAAAHRGRVYAIGGFDENDKPSRRVDVYDPASGRWTTAAELPLPARNGFGPAACTLGDDLYVSVADGSLYRLDDDARQWIRVATTTPRIVHRAVSLGDRVLVLGGADKGRNLDLIESAAVTTGAAASADYDSQSSSSSAAPSAAKASSD
jgi:hypothetical protein